MMTKVVLLGLLFSNMPFLPGVVPVAKADFVYNRQAFDLAFNGDVAAMATDASGNVYVGGDFTSVGPRTGGGVPVDATTALPASVYPKIGGTVSAVASDGSGGWYVGGSSVLDVEGQAKSVLHILSDGTLDPNWAPTVDGVVNSIAVYGTAVYLGGQFTHVTTAFDGTQSRAYAAAVSTSGRLLGWNPTLSSQVRAIAATASGIVLGGDFTSYIELTDPMTGTASSTWSSAFNANSSVYSFAPSGATLYIGGLFTSFGGSTHNSAAAVDIPSGSVLAWNPNITNPIICNPTCHTPAHTVNAIAVSGTTVYVGGAFSQAGGLTRNCAAAFDTSGTVQNWNPNTGCSNGIVANNIYGLTVSGASVYAVGTFSSIGGLTRNGIAALNSDPTSAGSSTSWNPGAGTAAGYAVAISGSTVYLGGSFDSIGAQTARNYLAAIDSSGNLLSWNPNVTGSLINSHVINTILVNGGDIYVGGNFSNVGGQARNYLAVLDASGNASATWNPGADGVVRTMVLNGGTLYVGGDFLNIGGQARSYIAALNAPSSGTGTATTWNPTADGTVRTMSLSSGTLYVGGDFLNIGGQVRNYLAAIDSSAGTATAWNPAPNASVTALTVSGNTIYFGGTFTQVGATVVSNLAAADTSGTVLSWAPGTLTAAFPSSPSVSVLVVSGTTVLIGGNFNSIGGQSRVGTAAVSATGAGTLSTWNSQSNGKVDSILLSGTTTYLGGTFTVLDLYTTGALAISFIPNLSGTANVTGQVPATLAFVIRNAADTANSNSCAMGALSSVATSTCSYRLRLATNGSGGFTVTIQANHDFGTGSATMTSVGDNLPVGAGVESYGVTTTGATSGGRNVATNAYDQPVTVSSLAGTTFDTSVSPVPTSTPVTFESFANTFNPGTAPSLGTTTQVTHFATIGPGTPAGDYSQNVTYIATANY